MGLGSHRTSLVIFLILLQEVSLLRVQKTMETRQIGPEKESRHLLSTSDNEQHTPCVPLNAGPCVCQKGPTLSSTLSFKLSWGTWPAVELGQRKRADTIYPHLIMSNTHLACLSMQVPVCVRRALQLMLRLPERVVQPICQPWLPTQPAKLCISYILPCSKKKFCLWYCS